MQLNPPHIQYINSHRVGHLATLAPNGTPQNKPVGYQYNADFGTIDIAGFNMEQSAKYRNIATHREVAFVIDDSIGEGPDGVRCLEIRGHAEQAQRTGFNDGLSSHLIRIHPRRIVSWNVDPDRPGLQTYDLADQ